MNLAAPPDPHTTPATAPPSLQRVLREQGFAFLPGMALRPLLEPVRELSDWPAFAASWDDLAVDAHMADHGRYRRRRHGTYAIDAAGGIVRAPHQPHWQALEYNPLNGGLARWFEPLRGDIGASSSLLAVLGFGTALFNSLSGPRPWHVEVHQFRIEARPDEPGKPTPEGVHRDGVDWVIVMMIQRRNIASGTTTIHDRDGGQLGEFTLREAFDAALVDDHRVWHGVTPVQPLDPSLPAHRDVLVATWRVAEPQAGAGTVAGAPAR